MTRNLARPQSPGPACDTLWRIRGAQEAGDLKGVLAALITCPKTDHRATMFSVGQGRTRSRGRTPMGPLRTRATIANCGVDLQLGYWGGKPGGGGEVYEEKTLDNPLVS